MLLARSEQGKLTGEWCYTNPLPKGEGAKRYHYRLERKRPRLQ
jgi:hypothetical protein